MQAGQARHLPGWPLGVSTRMGCVKGGRVVVRSVSQFVVSCYVILLLEKRLDTGFEPMSPGAMV